MDNKDKRFRHNLTTHPLYSVWERIKQRCYNKNHSEFRNYGANGIVMCEEWRTDFKKFYDWAIANGWQSGLEIDKDKKAIENGTFGQIYSPETCSIITRAENNRYRKDNLVFDYNGKRMILKDISELAGVNYIKTWKRIKRGWSLERSLS